MEHISKAELSPTIKENDETNDNLSETKKKWYASPFISLEIVKSAKNREVAFLGQKYQKIHNIRYINIGCMDVFFKYIGLKGNDPYRFLWNKKNYNIYTSLASIDWAKSPVQLFSFNNKKRKEQQELFKDHLKDLIYDFDGFLDFDGDQYFEYKDGEKVKVSLDIPQISALNRALRDLKKVKKLFDEYKIEYMILFSGNRGFQFRYKIPLNVSIDSKIDIANKLMNELANILNLKTLDLTRLNLRKVGKCPYSLVTDFVCLPLSDLEIDNFNLNNLKIENVIRNIKIKNRGLLERNKDLPDKENNFKKLLEDLEIEWNKKRN